MKMREIENVRCNWRLDQKGKKKKKKKIESYKKYNCIKLLNMYIVYMFFLLGDNLIYSYLCVTFL